ncbi:MAG: hypothetical protein JNL67_12085 [Planctomycetaceae bacterium]|nr:hypothetical protein [Planctomycetaceae bacterium]
MAVCWGLLGSQPLISSAAFICGLYLMPTLSIAAQDEAPQTAAVFSGPQVGEELPEFEFRELLVESSGREMNLVAEASGGPLVLVFVHVVNRPVIGLTRTLTGFTHERSSTGLRTAVVFLDADPTAAEATIHRIKHALTPGVPTGVSVEGQEGPGNYGLNRNVELTILVAKEGRVTANFALVQPSLPSDLPKVVDAIVAVAGGDTPKLSDLIGEQGMQREASAANEPNLRPLLQPMLNKNATDEQIVAAAEKVEQTALQDEAIRKKLGEACRAIVEAGVLGNYGTGKTQEYFKKWADQFGAEPRPKNQ